MTARAQEIQEAETKIVGHGSDKKLASELRNLGLLVDVKQMLDHIDTTLEFRCWPEIKKLGFFVNYFLEANVCLPRNRLLFAEDQRYQHQQSHPAPGSVQLRAHSALDIPEILELVFAHVDKYTLRNTVILVCRQWFLMNQHRILREIIWNDSWNSWILRRNLSKLPAAGRLCCYQSPLRTKKLLSGKGQDWDKLVNALKSKHNRYLEYQQQPSRQSIEEQTRVLMRRRLFDTPLQELQLNGFIHLDSWLPKILPYLQSLTTLSLTVKHQAVLHVDQVILSCPHLLSLQVKSSFEFNVDMPATTTTNEPDSSRHQRLQPWPLRSLVLQRVTIHQDSLGNLLSVTPRLQELKLVYINETVYENYQPKVVFDQHQIFRQVQSKSLPLRSFHLSFADEDTADAFAQEMVQGLPPTVSEWSFYSNDLQPLMIQSLQQIPNVVTTLELTGFGSGAAYQGGLQDYLCESPHLLHLKAPFISFMPHHMDLHGHLKRTYNLCPAGTFHWNHSSNNNQSENSSSSSSTSSSSSSSVNSTSDHNNSSSCSGCVGAGPANGRIWACRKLRTLHLGLHGYGLPIVDSAHPGLTRVLFGYISRVCPHLQDLQINAPWIAVSLEGGLCLSARLMNLERLSIRICEINIKFKSVDLDWMAPWGQGLKLQQKRQAVLNKYSNTTAWEMRQEEQRMRTMNLCIGGRRRWTLNNGRSFLRADDEDKENGEHNGSDGDGDDNGDGEGKKKMSKGRKMEMEGCVSKDDAVWRQLVNLGSLLDVKMMLEEMHAAEQFQCWPLLREISLYTESDSHHRLERAVERLLPGKYRPHAIWTYHI
ncbi:hypothetical protein BG011_007299 [Mortierella polycephala]|uniref:F-box domain-containing protein n=1 Tax=Mortierella polycephala TaxID=41804 RepID=A0A9P6PSL0_9FUNG|nr:hypothetical protein BG011_007299 [Mortierella polycephala]